MSNYLIEAANLKKSFGHLHAVDGVSLQIEAGEIYGLVGADGAGKTTTLRLLVGALKADAGEINICGYDINKQTEKARSQFGYLSQRFSLYEDLTVLENIRFFAEARGLKSNEWLPRCNEILKFVGLEKFKDRRAAQLSGGMKQKLGLASALVTRPRVLLLDEPTNGLDVMSTRAMRQFIVQLREEGKCVLFTSHIMQEVAALCDQIVIISRGEVSATGSPNDLRKQTGQENLEDAFVAVIGSEEGLE